MIYSENLPKLAHFCPFLPILLIMVACSAPGPQILRPELRPSPLPPTETVQPIVQEPVQEGVTEVVKDIVKEPVSYIRVDTPGLNLRPGPGTEFEKITTLVSGDIALVLDQKGDWLYVQYVDVTGWLLGIWTEAINGAPDIVFTQRKARKDFAQYFEHVINCKNANPYDGHIYQNACIPAVIDNAAWKIPYPEHTTGRAGRYYEGIMEIVLENRNLSADGYLGAVALESCAHIGETVFLKFGGGWEGPYLVADCGNRYGLFRIVAWLHMIVEVDAQTFERVYDSGEWNGRANVCFHNSCNSAPVDFRNYWLERLTYVEGK